VVAAAQVDDPMYEFQMPVGRLLRRLVLCLIAFRDVWVRDSGSVVLHREAGQSGMGVVVMSGGVRRRRVVALAMLGAVLFALLLVALDWSTQHVPVPARVAVGLALGYWAVWRGVRLLLAQRRLRQRDAAVVVRTGISPWLLVSAAAWPRKEKLGDGAVRGALRLAEDRDRHVWLHSTNRRNHSFYGRFGFRVIAREPFPGKVVAVTFAWCPASCRAGTDQCPLRVAADRAANDVSSESPRPSRAASAAPGGVD
jgi:hypothetical protein